MTDIDVPQAGQAIDILPPLGIPQVDPFPFHPHLGGLVIGGVMQWMEEMFLILLDQVHGADLSHLESSSAMMTVRTIA